MKLAVISPLALACSAVMSILASMIGRCDRKLPIDGMLPRVVDSARFTPEKNKPLPAPEPTEPTWPTPTKPCQQLPRAADAPPSQSSKLCATSDAMETDAESVQIGGS
jgi:hypothetical protein